MCRRQWHQSLRQQVGILVGVCLVLRLDHSAAAVVSRLVTSQYDIGTGSGSSSTTPLRHQYLQQSAPYLHHQQHHLQGNGHRARSAADHPPSNHVMSAADLERLVDEKLDQLEARFNQRLDEQSRQLNQSVAIQYIEKVLDYVSEELQDSRELITAGRLVQTNNDDDEDDGDGRSDDAGELSHEVDRQRGELARVKESISELQTSLDALKTLVNEQLQQALAARSRTPLPPPAAIVAGTTGLVTSSTARGSYPTDCEDAYNRSLLLHADGFQYTTIQPRFAVEPFKACCYVNNSVSWTVLQRRLDGAVDFYRNWDEYKRGFGQPEGEFWLGNERIYRLTSQGEYRLRIEMVTWDDNPFWAEYRYFRLAPETDRYRLHVSGYSSQSTAGDSLTSAWDNDHNGQPFSTYDSDNDARFYDNCAQHYRGAWWFRSCFQSHLNGVYYNRGSHSNFFVRNGIQWNTIHPHSSLRYAIMMVRR